MENNELPRLLGRLSFTAGLPSQTVTELAAISTHQHVAAGQVVFREGDECQSLFLIAKGRVVLDMRVPGREDMRILSLGAGDMLGWSAFIGEGRMTATARTLDDCELVVASAPQLLALCQDRPDIGYGLMRHLALALSKRLVATRLQLLDLFAQPDTRQRSG